MALLQDFIPKLKSHLLGRLLGLQFNGDEYNFSGEERNSVRIINNRIYSSKVLRVNYTTYDIRRDQDSMNPRTSCDVMVLSQDEEHPFWYARVLGVFHAQVLHVGPAALNRSVQHMEFLWVRWFGIEPQYEWGHHTARLPKIGFVPDVDESAFGFLDPSLVLRGCHLVPAFAGGRTLELLPTTSPTTARRPNETDDWANYYVIMYVFMFFSTMAPYSWPNGMVSWVDRDMFMRYFGGGIGHIGQRVCPNTEGEADVAMDTESEERVACDGGLESRDLEVQDVHDIAELGLEDVDESGDHECHSDLVSEQSSLETDVGHFRLGDGSSDSNSDLGLEDGEDLDSDSDSYYAF